ncbi:MAG: hypothetical protein PVS3B1_09530 [Ktedonobacteraceae bacterium]
MAIPFSPLLQGSIAIYFTINFMVLGTLLAVRLTIATIQALGELKKQRKEIREKFLLTPRSLSGRHNRTWRRQERWLHLSRRVSMRRAKGEKP